MSKVKPSLAHRASDEPLKTKVFDPYFPFKLSK